MSENVLKGRVALITGGSRGIGLATARALWAEGAKVALLARGAKELSEAAAEFGDSGAAIPADVSIVAEVEAAVTQVIEQQMNGIDNLLYITSTSDSAGNAQIAITFAPVFFAITSAPARWSKWAWPTRM